MIQYSFTTSFQIAAPLTMVWKTLLDFPHWKQWWKGIRELSMNNDHAAPTLSVRLGFPFYVLKIHLQITNILPHQYISFSSTGDLLGEGIFIFTEKKTMTEVRFDWSVATTKPWMNTVGKVAKPIFEFSHNLVMHWFVDGLATYLHTTVSKTRYKSNVILPPKSAFIPVLEKE